MSFTSKADLPRRSPTNPLESTRNTGISPPISLFPMREKRNIHHPNRLFTPNSPISPFSKDPLMFRHFPSLDTSASSHLTPPHHVNINAGQWNATERREFSLPVAIPKPNMKPKEPKLKASSIPSESFLRLGNLLRYEEHSPASSLKSSSAGSASSSCSTTAGSSSSSSSSLSSSCSLSTDSDSPTTKAKAQHKRNKENEKKKGLAMLFMVAAATDSEDDDG